MTRFLPFGSRSKVIQINSVGGGGGGGIPRDGLVAEYLLATNSLDTSGNGNNSIYDSTTYSSGSAVFNGVDSLIEIADSSSLDLTTSYSSNFWINYNVLPTSGSVYQFYYKFNSGTAYQGYDCLVFNNSGTYQIYVTHTGDPSIPGVSYFWNIPTPTVSTFYNICITYSDSVLSLYIDNVLIGSQAATMAPTAGTGVLSIGRDSTGIRYFNGKMKKARLYNRVLNAGEIAALYADA